MFLKVNQQVSGIDWLKRKENYRKRIERIRDDNSLANIVITILRELNYGHTNVLNTSDYVNYKSLYTISNKVFQVRQPHRAVRAVLISPSKATATLPI
ncbi:hypothetical protein DCC85_01845 [Paenibacillus sp. CAA11]|nr:hypothetical protein DCC85_01845 [Paenibacillus sp. CAA11]